MFEKIRDVLHLFASLFEDISVYIQFAGVDVAVVKLVLTREHRNKPKFWLEKDFIRGRKAQGNVTFRMTLLHCLFLNVKG